MADPATPAAPAPDAVQSVAQTRSGEELGSMHEPVASEEGEDTLFRISKRVKLAFHTRLYERRSGDPVYRPLSIYTRDPSISRLEGGIARTRVQYEPLKPGPRGSVVEVSTSDGDGNDWAAADLENPLVLIEGGYAPSLSDPRFHQQMVYAVAMTTYDSFKAALGRNVAWSFDRVDPAEPHQRNRVLLKPHGANAANAWYDNASGEIVFGYFTPKNATSTVPPGRGHIFTCTSHDIIAHEMSHALLDGLRAAFLIPSHHDVLAFHEAFADLIAFFQHFTYEDVVRSAVNLTRGNLDKAENLVSIAQEFGKGLGEGKAALRTLNDLESDFADFLDSSQDQPTRQILTYDSALREDNGHEPHNLGRVLARAVFAAFITLYRRKSQRYVKLATGGTGKLPDGDISTGLQNLLVSEVRKLAGQFLSICIRAIDYCPPVDVRFGDYLRALITADHDVVADDRWAYRETLIQAFAKRGIYPDDIRSMTEDTLLWQGPQIQIDPEKSLGFGSMAFEGDPAKPVSIKEMCRQAGVLGRLVTRPHCAREFGLVSPESAEFATGEYSLPVVESIRSARRIGPDKQVIFDIIAEVVQKRRIKLPGHRPFEFHGGATIILGPLGEIRYVIRKRVDHQDRPAEQIEFMKSSTGARFWRTTRQGFRPSTDVARLLCAQAPQEAAP
ncbi:hypothetical protein [Aurantimonas sp. NFXS3]|uniref:hypothetical protein n=1 Tax=Aurantimonas sp. NFXS3 TaxID=2818434 RepID=UPI003B8D30A0